MTTKLICDRCKKTITDNPWKAAYIRYYKAGEDVYTEIHICIGCQNDDIPEVTHGLPFKTFQMVLSELSIFLRSKGTQVQ